MKRERITPTLIVEGEMHGPGLDAEQWGLAVDLDGFIVPMARSCGASEWHECYRFPPKLAAHIELFITQNYHILNNQYGLPKKGRLDASSIKPDNS